uniref:WAP domain-containing protein n=1 Tax=Terrapene triunguis TaxID=2587831 RepID=A0A674K6V8_9SAUR
SWTISDLYLVELEVQQHVLPSLWSTKKEFLKLGTCPVVSGRCKMLNPPNRCQSDSQCAGAEKCCDTGCGLVTAKPGTCPLIVSTCRMINPPDKCKEDHDCTGPMKCCMSFCGKECLQPNQGTTLGQYF